MSISASQSYHIKRVTADSQASDEVSYRCDDLKTGKVIVYRAGV